MSIIKINGINLNVEIRGYGKPLILIHGLACDITQWKGEIQRLSESFKTVSLDCRGHGKSDKPDYYTLKDHVQDIISIMDNYGFSTANLYGVSMGSYIAQGVAIAQPNRIKKLILTVPKSNGLTSSTQRFFTEHTKEVQGLSEEERMMFLFKHMTYDTKLLLKHQEELHTNLTPKENAAANRAIEGFDYRGELHKIKAQTLIINGKYDELNPSSEGKICASLIPKSTFVEMQYSGHIPMVEEAETYNNLIDQFLND